MTRSMLTSIPVYSFMVLDPPLSIIKEIDKRRRVFLWRGTENMSGGHCLAWLSVCRPIRYGGLGLHNLYVLGRALRLCWL